MKILACRMTKAKHASDAFSGEGARISGGRWSSPGLRVVHTAGSAALAMLEMLVHLHSRELLQRYVAFTVEFDESLVETIKAGRLPRYWRRSPSPGSLRQFGDQWVDRSEFPVLRVPSVIVPTEWNYLLNALHPDFSKIEIGPRLPVKFDPRLA